MELSCSSLRSRTQPCYGPKLMIYTANEVTEDSEALNIDRPTNLNRSAFYGCYTIQVKYRETQRTVHFHPGGTQ